jgi:hypothetical protein
MSRSVRLPIIGGSGELSHQVVAAVGGDRIHLRKTPPRSNRHINARWTHDPHSATGSNATISMGEAMLTRVRKCVTILQVSLYHHSVYSQGIQVRR